MQRIDQIEMQPLSPHDELVNKQPDESSINGNDRINKGKTFIADGNIGKRVLMDTYFLQVLTTFVFAYLCLGEFIPRPLAKGVFKTDWERQEVLLLASLSFLCVLIGSIGGCNSGYCCVPGTGGRSRAVYLLAALNVVPIPFVLAVTHWVAQSDNCPAAPYDGSPTNASVECDSAAIGLDVVGVVSARLARFDLGISLLLATRGDSAWLHNLTGGWLGLPETIQLHRTAGWWCVAQSALHSAGYLTFYPWTGGLRSLWLNCFPTALPIVANSTRPMRLNRLGLVNFYGVVAFVAMLLLVLPALPYLRRRRYDVFQRLHLPVSMLFCICCALHDLPILLFAAPGIADWYLGWRTTRQGSNTCPCGPASSLAAPATANVLPGTSGPWIKLAVDCSCIDVLNSKQTGKCSLQNKRPMAPRGEWALVRVLPLGREAHPLSVAVSTEGGCATQLTALVTASAGDWSHQLAALSAGETGGGCKVEVNGVSGVGGGDWSLMEEPALLLVAGGTGVWGWLPALAKANAAAGSRKVHLIWCVQTEADYLSLASDLPRKTTGVQITVFLTRAATAEARQVAAVFDNDRRGKADRIGEKGGIPDDGAQNSNGGSTAVQPASTIMVWVSLFATLCALVAGFWGWTFVKEGLRVEPHTVASYTVRWRVLPIVIIISAIYTGTVLGSWLARVALAGGAQPARDLEAEDGRPLLEAEATVGGSGEADGSGTARVEHGLDAATMVCDIQTGRPNLTALVQIAAADVIAAPPPPPPPPTTTTTTAATASGRKQQQRRLVVAACGPAGLVGAARNAVVCVHKRGCSIPITFSGTDSRW